MPSKPYCHIESTGLVWSSAVPTQPGGYWHRYTGEHGFVSLVLLKWCNRQNDCPGCLVAECTGREYDADPERLGGEWAGPLPEPEG